MNKISIVLLSLCFISGTYSQSVDFTYQSTNGIFCSPSTIQFTQACTGNPIAFKWDFGNSQNGYNANETSTYNAPGTYTVKLTVSFKNTILQVSKQIVINAPIKAAIALDRDYICLPGVINFTGSGNGSISNYQWNFGDGTALLNTATANTNHNFTNFGTDTVTLRATNVNGCYGDTNIVVSVKYLPITASLTPTRGCVPTAVAFSCNVDIPLNTSVTGYTWNFGDGSPQPVTLSDTTSHTYSMVGIYSPIITITTSEGCTHNYYFSPVAFGSPPASTIAYPKKTVVCASDSAYLVSQGTNANRYFWNFGDGVTFSTTDTIVAHKYKSLGIWSIGLTAYYNGCPGVFTRTKDTIIGVIARYIRSNSCADKSLYSFLNTSEGNVSGSLWNFGDGFQLGNINNPVHLYPPSGQFLSSLIANDNITGCADTATLVINTAVPDLKSTGANVCKNDSVTFSIINNYKDTGITYTWNVLGAQIGPDSNAVITVNANATGSYTNFVVINRGPDLCSDKLWLVDSLVVRGPVLNFSVAPNICLDKPVVIINNSQPFIATDTVRLWYWNNGHTVQNDSVYQPLPYQYITPGTYNLTLTAIDKNGCKDTLTKTINVNPSPFLIIQPKIDTICSGQPVTLVALNNDIVLWSPGNNLTCINCDTTIATPLVSSRYYATVTNGFNCSVQDSNFIEVYTPFTTVPTSGNVSICSNEIVTLDAMPKGKKILWSPVTALSDPAIYNPIARPLQSTTFTATLTDSLGCFSSNTSFDVYVKSSPVVDAGPDKFYPKGTSFTFTPVYSSNVSAYSWTPSDLLSCNNCAIPSGVASYSQKYILKVTSDSGCVAIDSVTINTECKTAELYLPKAFTPNNDSRNDFYYPLTKSYRSIASFTIYNRQGKIVYSARNFPPNDKSFGWDGRFNGKEQSVDTYVYTLEAICDIGEKVFFEGSFILFR